MEQLKRVDDVSSGYDPRPGSNPTIDKIKVKIADGLKSAAAALKQDDSPNGSLSGYLNQASGFLDQTADYMENVNVSKVKSDIQRQTRANPGRALLIAGAAGLIVGALFRRR
jgi:ElaB/YqjD/DUF883 family membrane-anchored ribosome-binding protein